MAVCGLPWLALLLLTAAASASTAAAAQAAAAGPQAGTDVQVLLAIAKALDPTGRALPKWRADNTKEWCKQWLAEEGCISRDGTLFALDISQAGLRAAAPLQGTLPQQLPTLRRPLLLSRGLKISGPGITGKLPPWVLQVAYTVEITDTSIIGPLPTLPAGAQRGGAAAPQVRSLLISSNPKLSGPLPSTWPNVLRLQEIDLSSNALTGSIPDTWSTLDAVDSINLAGNKLSGSISRAWAKSSHDGYLLSLNVSGNAGMKGCLADARGQPWEALPFIDARGTPLLDCIKRQPALTRFGAIQQAGWSPASCNVPGYELKVRQLPLEWDPQPQQGADQRVLLYTIKPPNSVAKAPYPLASLSETAAACDALDACVMFTSDGFLIGAYRPVTDIAGLPKTLENEKRLGPWQWRPMRYCSSSCCGTWLSTGFDAQSLAAPAAAQSKVSPGSLTAASSSSGQLPGGVAELDKSPAFGVDPSRKRCAAFRAGDVSSFTCPPRCRVACCATEDAEEGSVEMSEHRYWQCSVEACRRSCGFQLGVAEAVSPPFTAQTVALYLAQKSKGKASKASRPHRSGASRGCTGSLC